VISFPQQFSCLALRENLTPELQLMKKMVVLLDPKSDNDSRLLAEKIGYEYSEIKWLETQQSPTETILDKWISDGKCLSDLKTYYCWGKEITELDNRLNVKYYQTKNRLNKNMSVISCHKKQNLECNFFSYK
jgi:hypothetical protein